MSRNSEAARILACRPPASILLEQESSLQEEIERVAMNALDLVAKQT